jgi:hypothetical protein
MLVLPGDLAALIFKLVVGTLAFVWILWTVRDVNPRAVGMMLTFPALNGIVLLTATDQIVNEMVVAIFPLMFFNALLASIFIVLRRMLAGRQWLAIALCLLMWAAFAALLEMDAARSQRWLLAGAAAVLILCSAAWAFQRLRAEGAIIPAAQRTVTAPDFLRDRGPRIFWFFVSLLIVSLVATIWRDAHTLVGRLSALPLVPLFVLHWAVNERRADLGELRLAALIGPVVAMGFLFAFAFTLSFIRTDDGVLHAAYWPAGMAALLLEWELARQAVLGFSRLTYRRPA